jgi:hypothetical protein
MHPRTMCRSLLASVTDRTPGATNPALSRLLVCVFAGLVCLPALALAQAAPAMFSNLANPAIGMNALFSGHAAHALDQPYGLQFDEAEISLISVVDPYWTLAGNIVFAPDGVDPEEVWARSTSIPAIQLKVGKLRGTFGKHGLLHTHAFPFIQAPIVMANTIGEEGFKDAGIEAAWLTPLPWYSELTGGLYQAIAADTANPLDFGSARHDNVPWLGHFKNQFDLSDQTTMEVGQSALTGRGSDGRSHSAFGVDLAFRNVPARNSNRRGWILQSEYLQRTSSGSGGVTREADGGYASLQYRLSQVWWLGIRGEGARKSFTDFQVDDTGAPVPGTVSRGSVNLAWTPSEFSFIRLEYSHARADRGIHPNDDRLMVQASYTIGYHPAHAY